MATKKMNAAVVEQFGMPLVLREWDVPTPETGQIVVKTEACGVCHTDLHAIFKRLEQGDVAARVVIDYSLPREK